jgi:predicted DNA-binding protein
VITVPVKPPVNKSLIFNASVRMSAETLDALDIIRRVSGTPAGQVLREAFEDQLAGLGNMHDRGYRCVREYRSEKATKRILNLNAWVEAWKKRNPPDAGIGLPEGV